MILSLKRQQTKDAIQQDAEKPKFGAAPMRSLFDGKRVIGYVFDSNPSALLLHRYYPEEQRKEILRWVSEEVGNPAMTLTFLKEMERERAKVSTDL